MRDSLNLAPVPLDEECAQLGAADYSTRSRKECTAFIAQLIRVFGEPPRGAHFKMTSNPHDFGTYRDVDIVFDDENDAACEYAYNIEANIPANWDEEALKELNEE